MATFSNRVIYHVTFGYHSNGHFIGLFSVDTDSPVEICKRLLFNRKKNRTIRDSAGRKGRDYLPESSTEDFIEHYLSVPHYSHQFFTKDYPKIKIPSSSQKYSDEKKKQIVKKSTKKIFKILKKFVGENKEDDAQDFLEFFSNVWIEVWRDSCDICFSENIPMPLEDEISHNVSVFVKYYELHKEKYGVLFDEVKKVITK